MHPIQNGDGILLNPHKIGTTLPPRTSRTGRPRLSAIAQVDIIIPSLIHLLVLELAMEGLLQFDLHDEADSHDLLLGELVTVTVLPVQESIRFMSPMVLPMGLWQDHTGSTVKFGNISHRFLLHPHLLYAERREFVEIGLMCLPLQMLQVVIDKLAQELIHLDPDILIGSALEPLHPSVLLHE